MIEFKTQITFPENPKERVLIEIPFNLWVEFGKEGMLEVDLAINGIQFKNIGLLPRGNGKYSIKFTKQMQKKVQITSIEEVSVKLELSEAIMEKEEVKIKEYRRINNPKLVMQTTEGNCGQACISMLSGIDIKEVCKIMHTNGSTSIGQIICALDELGIRHAEKNKRLSKMNPVLPEIAIITVHFPEYSHWVLYYKGRYLDPEFGGFEKYQKGKITSFLECFER